MDIHNQSPQSFNYSSGGTVYLDRAVQRVIDKELDVLMFTDHDTLPERGFVEELASRTGKLIIRGTELSVIVTT